MFMPNAPSCLFVLLIDVKKLNIPAISLPDTFSLKQFSTHPGYNGSPGYSALHNLVNNHPESHQVAASLVTYPSYDADVEHGYIE